MNFIFNGVYFSLVAVHPSIFPFAHALPFYYSLFSVLLEYFLQSYFLFFFFFGPIYRHIPISIVYLIKQHISWSCKVSTFMTTLVRLPALISWPDAKSVTFWPNTHHCIFISRRDGGAVSCSAVMKRGRHGERKISDQTSVLGQVRIWSWLRLYEE